LDSPEDPERVQNVHRMALNMPSSLLSNRQICVTKTTGMKNLVKVKTRTETRLAGATQNTLETSNFFTEFPKNLQPQIITYSLKRLNQGCTEQGVKSYLYCLRNLIRKRADLNSPESVKATVAKMAVANRTKNYHLGVYESFLKFLGKTWQKPKYTCSQKIPYIPLESELNLLIGGCSKTISTVLQTIKETGARIGEVARIRWEDVDFERRIVSINYPEKGSRARQIKVTPKLIAMLHSLPRKRQTIFAHKSQLSHQFYIQRKRLAHKLKNPRLKLIGLHSIRHWHATMEYHKTKNLLHVQQRLGHKNIQNTIIYTHLVSLESDEYHTATAKTVKETCKLIEAGFEYVCETNGFQVFRKRK
jgi:integrase